MKLTTLALLVALCFSCATPSNQSQVELVKATLALARGELAYAMDKDPDKKTLEAVDALIDAVEDVASKAAETGEITGRDTVEALLAQAQPLVVGWIKARTDLSEAERARREQRVIALASLIRAIPWGDQ